jgi:FkbM family methyltransferase
VGTSLKQFASATYSRALRAFYSDVGFPWAVHDETVRIHPDARHLVPHESEPALFHHLRTTIQPGDVVFDVGAFVGIYAILEARWSGKPGRVVAFEPTPSSAALARQHFAWNHATAGRIRLLEAAVSDRSSRATLHEYDAHGLPYANSLAAAVDTDRTPATREVSVVTIDDVCRELQLQPSVIRMDVQGAEAHALRGARETIRSARRLSIVVEMHPQCWSGFGLTEDDVRRTIADLGLTARPLVAGEALFGRDTHAVLERDGAQAP